MISDEKKIEFIEKFIDTPNELSGKDIDKFKSYVEEGCEKGWEAALYAKAYGCYGGNDIFDCDWDTSLECLLKLIDMTGDPYCYNTVGYIYYYGRCNNGEPEYDKAFQYFAVGAAHGIFESMYKIADMFIAGKGCLKNPAAGAKIILSMFNENREIFCAGEYDGKFADVALRVGGLFEKGIGVDKSLEQAYAFYLEAKLAIDERVAQFDYFGDKKVQRNIDEALFRVKEALSDEFFRDSVSIEDPGPIGALISNSVGADITLEAVKGGYKIKAKGFAGEDASGKVLINMPEMNYCKLSDEVEMHLDSQAEIVSDTFDLPYSAFITGIHYDTENEIWNFMYRDMVMLSFKSKSFTFKL